MKKKLAATLSVVLILGLAVLGILAYLTDEDSDVNVMTMGNVSIAQHEYERVVDENGNPVKGVVGTDFKADYGITESYKLQEFTQAKPAYPAVYQNGTIEWDEFQQLWNQVGAPGSNDLFDDSMKNVIDKFVFVENTGTSNAYYRTIVAIERPDSVDAKRVHLSFNNNSRFDDAGVTEKSKFYVGRTTIDGVQYSLYNVTYNQVLTPGEVSRPSLLQVYLDPATTNEECAAFGDTWEILVFSQAVQAAGFEDAQTALNTAFGPITTTNHPWKDTYKYEAVATADELIAALEAGEDVALYKDIKIDPANMSNAYGATGINIKNGQTIYGGGKTLNIKGAGGTWDSGINTTGGLIKDLTVTGSFRGIFINHNSTHSEPVILDNVTIDGTTYTISCDQGMNQTLTAKNSTFKGWTSFAATLGEAKFVDCYFGYGNGYSYCRPYAPTEFVGCDFEADFELDARAAVTFENCTIGGVALTADNLATLVTSNIANATVK